MIADAVAAETLYDAIVSHGVRSILAGTVTESLFRI